MRMCTHACTNTQVHASMHRRIYACIPIRSYTFANVRVYACMHVCMYAHIMYTCRFGLDTLPSRFAALLFEMARSYFGNPDASTLGATCFNVGMIEESSFARHGQTGKVIELAGSVFQWLRDGPAVVGLNEIHPNIALALVEQLEKHHGLAVGIATHESNSLLWRTLSILLSIRCSII